MRIVVVLSVLFLIACSGRGESSVADRSPSGKKDWSCSVQDDAYACLREACTNARAFFSEPQKTCQCRRGFVFTSSRGGECLPIEGQESRFVVKDGDQPMSVVDLSRRLERSEIFEFLKAKSVPIFPQPTVAVISFFPTAKQVANLFESDEFVLGRPPTELAGRNANKGVGGQLSVMSQQFYLLPSGRSLSVINQEITKLFDEALERLRQPFYSSVDILSEKGCAEICQEKTVLFENSRYLLERIRTFSGGNPFTDLLRLFDKERSFYVAAVILLNEEPSYLYVANEHGRVSFADLDGKPIKTIQEPIGKMQGQGYGDYGVPVAVFEGPYSAQVDRVAWVGPWVNESYYGWFRQNDFRPFYYGKVPTLFGEEEVSTPAHSLLVSQLASDGWQSPILPLSITTLSNGDFQKVWERAGRKKMVANLSVVKSMTPAICQQSILARQIVATEESVLWIAGAGNDAELTSKTGLNYCPQSLTRENFMVVASSGDGKTIAKASSFGVNYADVVTFGCVHGKKTCHDAATSYAAPRLSRQTADLFEKFPEVTPAQMKFVLMITSNVEHSVYRGAKWIEVRSGGFIDLVAAEKLLQLAKGQQKLSLLQNPKALTKDLLELLSEAKADQVNRWQRNELIEKQFQRVTGGDE